MPIGELYALLTLHAEQYSAGLAKAEGEAKGFGGSLGGIFAGVAKAALGIGIGVTVAAGAIAAKGLDMAEKLQRAQLLIAAAYGKSAAAVEAWAKANNISLGVSETDLDKSESAWGVYAKGIGLSTDQAAKAGEDLATRAAQIAAVSGQSFSDVFSSLEKGVQGATRGLKTYGVAIDPVVLRNEALSLGLIKGKEKLDLHSKAVATEALILKQTTPYVTAFGTAHDQAGFQVKQIGVIFDQTMTGIGEAVAPLVAKIMPGIVAAAKDASDWFLANLPTIMGVFETVFGAIGNAIGFVATYVLPLLAKAFGFVTATVLPAVQGAFASVSAKGGPLDALNTAFSWVTTNVLPALGAAFDWITKNVLPDIIAMFDVVSKNVLPILEEAFGTVVSIVQDNWPTISSIVGQVGGAVKAAFDVMLAAYKIVYPLLKQIADVLFPAIRVAASILLPALDVTFKAIGVIFQVAANVATAVVAAIGAAWTGLTTVISRVWSGIVGIIKGAINAVIGLINGIVDGIDSIQMHIDLKPPVGPEIKFDWNGVGLGHLGYLASGTQNWPGGWAVAGENGPELINLPGGSRVFPADQTASMLGGGKAPLFGSMVVNGLQPDEVERQVRRGFRRAQWEQGLSGRATT